MIYIRANKTGTPTLKAAPIREIRMNVEGSRSNSLYDDLIIMIKQLEMLSSMSSEMHRFISKLPGKYIPSSIASLTDLLTLNGAGSLAEECTLEIGKIKDIWKAYKALKYTPSPSVVALYDLSKYSLRPFTDEIDPSNNDLARIAAASKVASRVDEVDDFDDLDELDDDDVE